MVHAVSKGEMERYINLSEQNVPLTGRFSMARRRPHNSRCVMTIVYALSRLKFLLAGHQKEPRSSWMLVSNDGSLAITFKVYVSVQRVCIHSAL